MDSWLQVVEKDKTRIMHMRLVDHQGQFKYLLVTHYNEKILEPDVASDSSSAIRRDKGNDATEPPTSFISDVGASDSDTTISSTPSSSAESRSRNLAKAKARVDW
ncbi:hypothetical protein HO133_008176 [Letharia lupina]|uniref:Uncharacterized protein n=1 Tax=Letharia lupina TaxID=560253 RepID=A0A8H6CSB8_9LECA|nr:uncharacterized protein HO133_008176 [Letharia lupina]KAF6228446.1 hypothetical protein HO133_008176 [Letharia lupina]